MVNKNEYNRRNGQQGQGEHQEPRNRPEQNQERAQERSQERPPYQHRHQGRFQNQNSGQRQNQGGQNLVLVSKINDQSVTTLGQEDLGEVDDIVFDALSGKVAFAVISGGDADNTAVPWSLLRVEPDGRLLAAQLDRNRLQGAPQFDDVTVLVMRRLA